MTRSLTELVTQQTTIVCCGSGGVGKTTISAALGVACAMNGRRVCIVTIDPARRLADALSSEHVKDVPVRIAGDYPGELYAVMFDARKTFDELVRRYAKDAEQAERITSNRLYKNLVSTLSGTQEYMATEKLYELFETGDFDCIIVDTPPTNAALDFLNAPGQVAGFIDNRIFRTLLSGGRSPARAFGFATQMVLRTINRVAGSEIVDDAVAFFQAFDGMENGFKERAARVDKLLSDPSTSYTLVTTPRRTAIDEARSFAERLGQMNRSIDAVIINRVFPEMAHANFSERPPYPPVTVWDELMTNMVDLSSIADGEATLLQMLESELEETVQVRIPVFPTDVHDLDSLAVVARYLLS